MPPRVDLPPLALKAARSISWSARAAPSPASVSLALRRSAIADSAAFVRPRSALQCEEGSLKFLRHL
jgi:hypothetical protein